MSEWVKVAQFSELADKEMKAVREKGEHIAVVQAEGQVYAFEDYCTHAFCSFIVDSRRGGGGRRGALSLPPGQVQLQHRRGDLGPRLHAPQGLLGAS